VSVPVSNDPHMGDTVTISAMKINALMNLQAGKPVPPPGSGLTTLFPSGGDSLEMSLKKINGLLANGARALPLVIAPPQVVFAALNTWYDVVAPVAFPLSRTGVSLVCLAASIHFKWTAGNNSEAVCDWSMDAALHYKRTWHKRTSGDAFIGGVDLNFYMIYSGANPTIRLQGRQVEGPINLTIIPRNDPTYPELESIFSVFDIGPINP
jgi:hypothetical protein